LLYLVATPIGHLGDITFRAVEILKNCDLILCEDTRHSQTLLKHYDVSKPLKSFHQHNEQQMEEAVIAELRAGKTLALITDAGTPGICDPGYALTQRCLKENLPWTLIPGPCALIQALVCSGMDSSYFQFVGFLPRAHEQKQKFLQSCLQFKGTTICYEAPHRIQETLEALAELAPERKLAIARELTKKFEEVLHGTAAELAPIPLKGEIILLIQGDQGKAIEDWAALSIEDHVAILMQEYKLSKNDAIKMAAEMRGLPKRIVYNKMHKATED
jgi:16S rRNA (cytidine1402-2'-O)-methyltransferase